MNSLELIHRDIKPENIMVQEEFKNGILNYRYKICDFGLAMKFDAKEIIYKRCGTPGFVPPEIIMTGINQFEKHAGRKWDTFSIGSILYMLISKFTSQSWFKSFPSGVRQRNTRKNRGMQDKLQSPLDCQAIGPFEPAAEKLTG